MPRPLCPMLVQGMVNLSSTTYKYRGASDTKRVGGGKGKRKLGGKILEKERRAVTEREARREKGERNRK